MWVCWWWGRCVAVSGRVQVVAGLCCVVLEWVWCGKESAAEGDSEEGNSAGSVVCLCALVVMLIDNGVAAPSESVEVVAGVQERVFANGRGERGGARGGKAAAVVGSGLAG